MGGLAIMALSMLVAPAPARRPAWVFFLVGLVLLASSQYALRDPRSQALPVSFLAGADVCSFHGGTSHSPTSSNPTHAQEPHCPLCIIGGFSDGAPAMATLPPPSPRVGARPKPLEAPKPHIRPVFPLLNRGPPLLA